MNFNEYQEKAQSTAVYPKEQGIVYTALGMIGETGEIVEKVLNMSSEAGKVAEKIKKVIRDHEGIFSDEAKVEIAKEVGDVLWYIASLSKELGFSMEEIAQMNLDKLASRKQRNQLHGNGDNR